MSVNVQARGGRFQLRVRHRLLPRPFFFTFPTDAEAEAYGQQLQALLDRGIVPAELYTQPVKADDPLLVELIRGYLKDAPVTDSDSVLLGVIEREVAGVRLSGVTALWVDTYVRSLKLDANLAPGSIRKRVGSLARVVDWHRRRTGSTSDNPLRSLPVGYSGYSRAEAERLPDGKAAKRDQARTRRLHDGEEAAILGALAGVKNPARERALAVDPEFALFFRLIVTTGLRLREAYRLRHDSIDVARRLLLVDGSKGSRGAIKPRTVPIGTELLAALQAHLGERRGLVFSFWTGDPDDLKRASSRLSARFASTFSYAGCADLTEHDLRHEATCRWVTMRGPSGWLFSEIEVCKIMGWSDPRMMLRYASLRGADLSDRLA